MTYRLERQRDYPWQHRYQYIPQIITSFLFKTERKKRKRRKKWSLPKRSPSDNISIDLFVISGTFGPQPGIYRFTLSGKPDTRTVSTSVKSLKRRHAGSPISILPNSLEVMIQTSSIPQNSSEQRA